MEVPPAFPHHQRLGEGRLQVFFLSPAHPLCNQLLFAILGLWIWSGKTRGEAEVRNQ